MGSGSSSDCSGFPGKLVSWIGAVLKVQAKSFSEAVVFEIREPSLEGNTHTGGLRAGPDPSETPPCGALKSGTHRVDAGTSSICSRIFC